MDVRRGMEAKEKRGEAKMLVFLFTCFFLAGFLNGFSGAGGGMVLGLCLPRLFGESKTGDAFAYIALSVFLFSLVSAGVYLFFGRMTWRGILTPFLPAVVGGALGGVLLKRINPTLLKCLFAGLLIYAGGRFLWG